jgi:expansin (peptidoglycan-binding protein)
MSLRGLLLYAILAVLAVGAFATTKVNYKVGMSAIIDPVDRDNVISAISANTNLQGVTATAAA